jgi:hypothetical protein
MDTFVEGEVKSTHITDVWADGIRRDWLCEPHHEEEEKLGLGERSWLSGRVVALKERRLLVLRSH